MKDSKLYIVHMLECIQKIEEYTKDGKDVFMDSGIIQDAVTRNFEIIGEAAKHVDATVKERHPEIPWKTIAGFRDVLIHDYMGVDLEEVWMIVEEHIQPLKSSLLKLTLP